MDAQVEFRIDYIQFASQVYPRWMTKTGEDFAKASPKPFYKRMVKYQNGAEAHSGNPNSDKVLYVLSGKACEDIGVNQVFVKSVIESGCKVSRIDFAMTTDKPILERLYADQQYIESKKYSALKMITDKDKGIETMYFGDMKKRAKKGIVRAYDKALELDLSGVLHRVEYEARRDDANLQAKRFAKGEAIPSIINSRFKVNRQWWRDIFLEGIATKRFKNITKDETPEIQRKMAWIMKQVLPALQYVIDYDHANGTNNMETVLKELKWH